MDELYIAQAADKVGPRTGTVWADAITASSTPFDIIGTLLPRANGKIVELVASVDIYYRWADANTDTVDGTAVSPSANVGFFLVAGSSTEHVPQGRYLIVQGTGAGIVRLAITSSKSRVPNPPTPTPVNT
jgi:hypothetical protein